MGGEYEDGDAAMDAAPAEAEDVMDSTTGGGGGGVSMTGGGEGGSDSTTAAAVVVAGGSTMAGGVASNEGVGEDTAGRSGISSKGGRAGAGGGLLAFGTNRNLMPFLMESPAEYNLVVVLESGLRSAQGRKKASELPAALIAARAAAVNFIF